MAPKSKTKAKSTVGAKARAKAGSGASSPEPKSKAKAKAQPGEELPEKKNRKQKAEALLRECLAEPDIARVDGRVLDIAVLDGKTKVVDAELLSKAEHRLQEWHAFQEELQKIAEELRVQKAEVVARHDEENVLFHSACDTRQGLKKRIEELFSAIENGELNKVKAWYRDCVSIEPDGDYPAPPLPLDVEDHEVTTPLAEAAAYGEVEIVQFLLEHGAHPDCVNCHGKSSLYRSTSCGTEREQEIVEILLEHGADPLAGEVEVGKYGTDGTKKLIGSWSKDHTAERKEKLRPLQRLREPWPRHLLNAVREGQSEKVKAVIESFSKDSSNSSSSAALSRTVDVPHDRLQKRPHSDREGALAERCEDLLALRAGAIGFRLCPGGRTCLARLGGPALQAYSRLVHIGGRGASARGQQNLRSGCN